MVAVGKSDPTYPSLFDALQKARALAEFQPVQDRIASTEFFHHTRQRVETERKGVETAKAELAKAEAKLAFEEDELSCCCVASGCLFPPPLATAGVACHSILVATTEQLALWLGCWAAEASHWRVPPRGFVARHGRGCRWTFVCRIWIWPALDNRRLEVVADGLPLFQ